MRWKGIFADFIRNMQRFRERNIFLNELSVDQGLFIEKEKKEGLSLKKNGKKTLIFVFNCELWRLI